jgi:hypothetical protein
MVFSLQARYLDIEWQEPGHARSVTVAPEPIEVERQPDGNWVAETQVFHGLCPWVGLHLEGAMAHMQPTFEGPDGRQEPMLRISDSQGKHWWVQEHGWDATGKRHLSELHRSMGRFTIWVGEQRLQLNNVVDELDRTSVEDYLRDFQQDLIWLVMGFGGATATTGTGPTVNKGIVEALEAFAAASRRVLTHPAQHVREISTVSRPARLRPNVGTFREYLRNPSAQHLTGRGAEETPDIADNRYGPFVGFDDPGRWQEMPGHRLPADTPPSGFTSKVPRGGIDVSAHHADDQPDVLGPTGVDGNGQVSRAAIHRDISFQALSDRPFCSAAMSFRSSASLSVMLKAAFSARGSRAPAQRVVMPR